MVGKMPNVTWLEGSFVETVKGWQSGWFYITEPRDANWVATSEFRSSVPMRLTSWQEKGVAWGLMEELTELARCFKLNPRSSVMGGGVSPALKSTFQMSSGIVPKSSRSVWCLAESNSHRLNARL